MCNCGLAVGGSMEDGRDTLQLWLGMKHKDLNLNHHSVSHVTRQDWVPGDVTDALIYEKFQHESDLLLTW